MIIVEIAFKTFILKAHFVWVTEPFDRFKDQKLRRRPGFQTLTRFLELLDFCLQMCLERFTVALLLEGNVTGHGDSTR